MELKPIYHHIGSGSCDGHGLPVSQKKFIESEVEVECLLDMLMSLRFIYGRAGSGKSRYSLEMIKKKIESGNKYPLIMLVPEQFSFQAEKNLIDVVGTSGVFQSEVLSFRRMAFKIFNEVGGITRQHMNSSGKSMLLYKIIDENKANLSIFKKSADRAGFIDTVSQAITEFKRYNVTPQMLAGTNEDIKDASLKQKVNDIAFIYGEFEKRLHENYIDAEDDLALLYDKLDNYKKFFGAEFWLDEFYSFTPQEYKIIEKLLKIAKRVNITLCTDGFKNEKTEDFDLFLPSENTHMNLINIAKDNNIAIDEPIRLNCNPCIRFKKSKEISHLEKNLFSYPYNIYNNATSDVCLFRASNKYSEVEETARDILKLCREKGIRYKDVAVVTGDMEGYKKLIKAVFSEYEIPCFIDERREINSNPIITLIVSAAEILAKNWSYESVMRYLRCGLINIEPEDIDILENYVLANGIRGSKWTQKEDWNYALSYEISDDEKKKIDALTVEKINNIRREIAKPLEDLNAKIEKSQNARDMCTALYEYIIDIKADEKVQQWIDEFKKDNNYEKSGEYNQIWNIVTEVLDQIVDVIGNEKISKTQFAKLLNIGFKEYNIGLIPLSNDQVLVGSIKRLRSHNISVTYIIGANDGIFPSALKGDGIFTDAERESLNSAGVKVADSSRTKAFEEQFLIYSTLTTSSRYLRLSFPVADDEGKAMRPSIIISRLKKIFPNICEKSNVISKNSAESDINNVAGKKATFNEFVAGLRKTNNGLGISPVWLEVYREYISDENWRDKLKLVLEGFSYDNDAEIMDTSKVRKLYGTHLTLSVSKLEKFMQCPFSYFVQYGLKAKERKTFKLSSPDMGSFLHEALHNFSQKLKDENIAWNEIDMKWAQEAVDDIVHKMMNENKSSILLSSFRYKYITERMKKTIIRVAWLTKEQVKRGRFLPCGYEISFNKNGDYPPISIKMHSGEKADLIGIIDRLDILEGENNLHVRIIDYKSGNKDLKLSDIYYGLDLQLLVYLDAVLTDMSKETSKDVLPGGVFYLRMDNPIIKGDPDMSDDKIKEALIKDMKMKGILSSDMDVVNGMDENIKGNSLMIPVSVNNDGSLRKNSAVITYEQFDYLRKYVKDTISAICEEILEGNISIKPCKDDKNVPCEYCIFSEVCEFDAEMKESSYRILSPISDDSVWDKLKNKYGSKGDEDI